MLSARWVLCVTSSRGYSSILSKLTHVESFSIIRQFDTKFCVGSDCGTRVIFLICFFFYKKGLAWLDRCWHPIANCCKNWNRVGFNFLGPWGPLRVPMMSVRTYVRAKKFSQRKFTIIITSSCQTYQNIYFWKLMTPRNHWRSEMTEKMTNTHIHKYTN